MFTIPKPPFPLINLALFWLVQSTLSFARRLFLSLSTVETYSYFVSTLRGNRYYLIGNPVPLSQLFCSVCFRAFVSTIIRFLLQNTNSIVRMQLGLCFCCVVRCDICITWVSECIGALLYAKILVSELTNIIIVLEEHIINSWSSLHFC